LTAVAAWIHSVGSCRPTLLVCRPEAPQQQAPVEVATMGPRNGANVLVRPLAVRLAVALLGLTGLLGCTTVTVHAGDGTVTVDRSFGFLTLRPQPGQTPMVLRSTALGWQSGPMGHSVGYHRASLTLLPPGCHLVLIDADLPRLASGPLQHLTGPGLCLVDSDPPGER